VSLLLTRVTAAYSCCCCLLVLLLITCSVWLRWAADEVLQRGVALATVRRIFQGVASLGPALCMAALALNVDSSEGDVIAHMPPEFAAALFVGSVSLGGASAGGFASSLLDIRFPEPSTRP
jgi:hypothetical protein